MLRMADGGDAGKGAEQDASMRSRCWPLSQKYSKVIFAVFVWGQNNGMHLYILYQASWWPQRVGAAPGAPLSLKGQLCSHEAPANAMVEKPKGTKFRMSDASRGKIRFYFLTLLTPPPSRRRVLLLLCISGFQIWSISIHGLYSPSCATNLTSHGRPLEATPVSLKHLI